MSGMECYGCMHDASFSWDKTKEEDIVLHVMHQRRAQLNRSGDPSSLREERHGFPESGKWQTPTPEHSGSRILNGEAQLR